MAESRAQSPSQFDGGWMPAVVPGDLHLALLCNGRIPDPFYRDVAGFDLAEALEQFRGFFKRFGGHAQAVGLTMPIAKVDAFVKQFTTFVEGLKLDRTHETREDGDHLALNSSALLEDLWAQDDTLWARAPSRRIHFEDMVARRKAELLAAASARPRFEEKDFACYTDDEIRAFAFDVRKLFLAERAKHLAICSRCQRRLEYWSGLVENFDRATPLPEGRANA